MRSSPRPRYRALAAASAAALLLGLSLAAPACDDDDGDDGGYASETAASCVAQNHPDDGHGWESDEAPCASGPPGSPPTECPAVTPQSIAEQCEADGAACDADAFITRDAAVCIAEADGLEEGLGPWEVQLVYQYGEVHRPVWSVSNTTLDDPSDCRKSGHTRTIDAETGEVLQSSSWMAIC
ncbi:MAG: hypothetical protein KDK70_21190 [Myxococcales bacterium]|nr:hypothetical protein [Myxococcales bacterium]